MGTGAIKQAGQVTPTCASIHITSRPLLFSLSRITSPVTVITPFVFILHQLSQRPLLFPSLLYLAVCGCSGAVSGEVVRLVPVELESPAWHRVR